MDNAVFDELTGSDPSLIPGIYNYCDRRCDRCPFTARCFSYRQALSDPAVLSSDPTESVARIMSRSLERTMGMLRAAAERLGIDLSYIPDDIEAEVAADISRRDPLVEKGREYCITAWPIVRALRPLLEARGDAAVLGALDTIEYLCTLVASKIYRAVSGTTRGWSETDDLQSDANGSAKVARLMIADSRRAWSVLMEAGRATADGVPARLVECLDELDTEVSARFPHAMQFIRPGFDQKTLDFPSGVQPCPIAQA
jgi:hypothetical protein